MEITILDNKFLKFKNSLGEIIFEPGIGAAPSGSVLKKANALFGTNADSDKGEGVLHLKTPGEFEVSDFSVMCSYLNKVEQDAHPTPQLAHLVSSVGSPGSVGVVLGEAASPSDESIELLDNARIVILKLSNEGQGMTVKQATSLVKQLSCEFLIPITEDAALIDELVSSLGADKVEQEGAKINTKKLQKTSESIAVVVG